MFLGDTPDSYRGDPSSTQHPAGQPGRWPGAGRKRPGVGSPLNFSALVAPLHDIQDSIAVLQVKSLIYRSYKHLKTPVFGTPTIRATE